MKRKKWSHLLAGAYMILMSGKFITPNGDGINDRLFFDLSSPASTAPQTTVVDVRGRRIGELRQESPTRLSWDGRDDSGSVVESGIYLFQIQQENERWHGVASVAK